MGVSKVTYGSRDLIDLTGDTVTADDLVKGVTAHGADGEAVEGTISSCSNITEYPYTYSNTKHSGATVKFLDAGTNGLNQKLPARIQLACAISEVCSPGSGKYIFDKSGDTSISLAAEATLFGDATAEDVAAGKTFTSAAGLMVTGTHECAADPVLQEKTVTPAEMEQTVAPDEGYDGLSAVTVEAVSGTYVGSAVPQKAAAAYTPGTADQVIAAGQYLSGDQTIGGDANLIAGNIKSGVSIFGVEGAYEGSGGSGGLSVRTGTTTSGSFDTGLSEIKYLVLYKTAFGETGLMQAVYIAEEGKAYYTYCSSYSSYIKTCSLSSHTSSTTSGGTFTWGGTNTAALSSGKTYYWVAFGTE